MMGDSLIFLFAGGGTGGHLFPGIAVAEELLTRVPDARILFAGSERDVESAILTAAGFRHVALPSPPSTMLRRHPLKFVRQYFRACREARRIVTENRPAVVIGLGGFASVPLVTAAKRARIPIALLEQNAVAGRATCRLTRLANVVCHAFSSAIPPGKSGRNAVVTGNPLRKAIAVLAERTPSNDSPSTLLVLGGSQGSTAVNDAMLSAVRASANRFTEWRIMHQCGPNDRERVAATYERLGISCDVSPFFDDLPNRYSQADVAVSRAGATTLAELACAGIPVVLIPYPNAVKDHQTRNAELFATADAATVVMQQAASEQTGHALAAALVPLLTDRKKRRQCSDAIRRLAIPNAAANVADRVLELARRNRVRAGS